MAKKKRGNFLKKILPGNSKVEEKVEEKVKDDQTPITEVKEETSKKTTEETIPLKDAVEVNKTEEKEVESTKETPKVDVKEDIKVDAKKEEEPKLDKDGKPIPNLGVEKAKPFSASGILLKIFGGIAGIGILLSIAIYATGALISWMGQSGEQTPRSFVLSPNDKVFGVLDVNETTNNRNMYMPNTDSSRLFSDERDIPVVNLIKDAIFLTDGKAYVYHKISNLDTCVNKGGDFNWCFKGEPHRKGSVNNWNVSVHWFGLEETSSDVIIHMDHKDGLSYKISILLNENGSVPNNEYYTIETLKDDGSGDQVWKMMNVYEKEKFAKLDNTGALKDFAKLVKYKEMLIRGQIKKKNIKSSSRLMPKGK